MSISQRITSTIEDWRKLWGKALHDFLAGVLSWGLELIMDITGEGLIKQLDKIYDRVAKEQGIPPEVVAKVKETWKGKGEWQVVLGSAAGGTAVGSLIGSTIGPWLKLLEYTGLKIATPYRLDPLAIITAWRRDPEKYQKLFDDLRDQGWDDDRIEALKFLTLYYPSPAELIHWTAREVFEPDKIAKYGLMADADKLRREDFYKAGMDDEQIDNHWIAHWEHASWVQIIEMLHRGIITEQDVKDWFPLVEMAPYWAENLIKIAYTWPTRVDVRRWWDMRTISPERLEELYKGMGYRDENLKDYIRWTKVYTDFPMMMARFKNGWITEDDIRNWLISLDIPPERVEQFIQEKTKPEKPERVAKERDLTKADIYKGVKKEIISWSKGVELLQELGYDKDEAEFILAINVPIEETITETKRRELTKADVLKGLKTGVITRAEAYSKLLELRYMPADADFLLKIFEAAAKPPEEPRAREVSKADITKAVKDGLIEPEEGYLMLQDIGFSPEAAAFILAVRAEASPFSPTTRLELEKQIQLYKQAEGLKTDMIPEEIIEAEKEVARARAIFNRVTAGEITDVTEAEAQIALSNAEYRYRQLLVKWEEEKKKLS